jgi:hypothetical protein
LLPFQDRHPKSYQIRVRNKNDQDYYFNSAAQKEKGEENRGERKKIKGQPAIFSLSAPAAILDLEGDNKSEEKGLVEKEARVVKNNEQLIKDGNTWHPWLATIVITMLSPLFVVWSLERGISKWQNHDSTLILGDERSRFSELFAFSKS